MQWILQEFEDTAKLADALERLEIPFTLHKVVPFVGDLLPAPHIENPNSVVMFGAYTLWRYAAKKKLHPGVFKITPFINEEPWHPYLLNGPGALIILLRDIPEKLETNEREWFLRPVDDSKEEPGNVKSASDIVRMAERVLALKEDDIPRGSLRHDTMLMLTEPVSILKEWRVWIVNQTIVTYSLYKEGSRVVYRSEIDDDALEFARQMVQLNPDYSPAYVMDICRTADGLRLLETNCINAAGFYAADTTELVKAIEKLETN
ncbi:ATP-grasp domain-containing protein [Roseibium sp. SCPC15]|uniref:ATP-grasp domain-containing protein n=1 Tax=Roseibium sp. SCP15 TaxID=3141376 RepID=UPI00333B9A78